MMNTKPQKRTLTAAVIRHQSGIAVRTGVKGGADKKRIGKKVKA